MPDLGNDRAELGRRRDQRGDIGIGKRSLLDGLHDQYAVQQTSLHHRHTEKRVIRRLASLGEIFETRMLLDIGDHDGLHLLGHHPRQSFTQVHADLSDTVLAQPHSRRQDQMGAVGFK